MRKIKFTDTDFEVLKDMIKQAIEYEETYKNADGKRKEIAKDLRTSVGEIYDALAVIAGDYRSLSSYYATINDSVTEPLMCLELLVKLANVNGEKYQLKRFIGSVIPDLSLEKMNNEQKEFWRYFYVISDKEVIDELSKKDFFTGSNFGLIAEKIVKDHSLILLKDYMSGFVNNAFPPIYDCDREDIPVGNKDYSTMYLAIECYLQNDELKEAVDKFIEFGDDFGYDIEGIEKDKLFDLVNNKKSKKQLVKKCNN